MIPYAIIEEEAAPNESPQKLGFDASVLMTSEIGAGFSFCTRS